MKSTIKTALISGVLALGLTGCQQKEIETPLGASFVVRNTQKKVLLSVVTEKSNIICVHGVENFPNTRDNTGVHPKNELGYEMRDATSLAKGKSVHMTRSEDGSYGNIRDTKGNPILLMFAKKDRTFIVTGLTQQSLKLALQDCETSK